MYTDLRIKIRHFFRKNAKIIFIVISVWAIVFFINMILKNYKAPIEVETTYKPHTSVMDESKSVPKKTSTEIENMIDEYMKYCNDSEWDKAYNMLSDTCKEYGFNNDLKKYMEYMYTKMPTQKKYAIQDYSNEGNTYVYQIKYSDDMLATGLTNTTYQYTEEKMVFKKQKDGTIEMSVGNLIDYDDIKNISETEYLKIDVKSVIKFYSKETYEVKFTNRSDYTIVIADNQESNEVNLMLKSKDNRKRVETDPIVLNPNESKTLKMNFSKFYDSNDKSQSITFNSIRVMEKYSGTNVEDDVIQSEIQNAISKFSVTIPVDKK